MSESLKKLKNKVVLVTGGAGGIGSAICQKLAEEGANVIITYNSNLEKAENLLKMLEGKNHRIFHAPITDAKKLEELSDFIKINYGKLDILVNNAGITTPVPHNDLDGLTDEWIDKIMQTNVRGTFSMIRTCKNLLLEAVKKDHQSASALVVNISSIAGVTGIGSNVAYCASKAAIDSITRSLGRSLAPNIRVVSVSPGWVLGEYSERFDSSFIELQKKLTPLNNLATPQDVANTVFALATCLTFTTGSIIPVDGGRTLGNN